MKYIFLIIWYVLVFVGIILWIVGYIVAWPLYQLWDFKYRKFTWGDWSQTSHDNLTSVTGSGYWHNVEDPQTTNPWQTYIKFCKLKL